MPIARALTFLGALLIGAYAHGDQPRELLRKAEAATRPPTIFDASFEMKGASVAEFEQQSGRSSMLRRYRSDGRRHRGDSSGTSHFSKGQEIDEREVQALRLWDGEKLYSFDVQNDALGAVQISDPKLLGGWIANDYVAPLFGSAPGDYRTVFSILQDEGTELIISNPLVRHGHYDCVELSGTNSHGKYTLWLAIECDYRLVGVRLEKVASSYWYGGKLSDESTLPLSFRPKVAQSAWLPAQAYTFELKDVLLERRGQHWVPTAGKHIKTQDFGENRGTVTTVEISLRELDLDFKPQADVFKPDFPDGATVIDSSMPQFQFIWRDGRPHPVYDNEAVDQIDKDVQRHR